MIDLSLIQWELAVTGLLILILLLDLFVPCMSKCGITSVAVIGLGVFILWDVFVSSVLPSSQVIAVTAGGHYRLDPLAIWGKRFAMLATLLSVLMSRRSFKDDEHFSEYILIQLSACLGMMLVVSANDLFSLFVFLELLTVSFYVLVSYRRKDILCLEAGVKYLIYGALSSGILLYGIALAAGTAGSSQFHAIADYAAQNQNSSVLLAAMVLILVGVAFKIAAVPFHWWVPDVYEGAPTPSVALLSTGSKAAGFVLLLRILFEVFPAYQSHWLPMIMATSGASILLGNLGGLSQTNLKRLMGYSSISHSGYLLLGIAAATHHPEIGLAAVLYYLVGYLLANALVFKVMCESESANPRQNIRAYAGLGQRSSWLGAAMVMGLLSLSGIPPLAGFFGKLLIFRAALEENLLILLAIALVGVVASLYYYLNIIRAIYFGDAKPEALPLPQTCFSRFTLAALMIFLVLIGFYQSPWWDASQAAIRAIRP